MQAEEEAEALKAVSKPKSKVSSESFSLCKVCMLKHVPKRKPHSRQCGESDELTVIEGFTAAGHQIHDNNLALQRSICNFEW